MSNIEENNQFSKRDLIQQRLAQDILKANCNLLCDIAVRTGKCRIILNYIISPEDRVLIVYPRTKIRKSWEEEFVKVGFDSKNIKFITTASFHKVKNKFDYLILDEVHKLSPKQLIDVKKYVNFWEVKKVIGLSGSISIKTEKELNEGLGLYVKCRYSIDQAVEDGIIKDYQINIVEIPLSTKKVIEVKTKTSTFYTSEKSQFDYYTGQIAWMMESPEFRSNTKLKIFRLQRMNIIKNSKAKADLIKELLIKWRDKRILVFTGLQKISDSLGIGSYHSNSENDKSLTDFIESKINHLAVVDKVSEGVTFRNLNCSIIGFFDSNEENLSQRIGRTLVMEYNNKAEIFIITTDEPAEKKWLQSALSLLHPSKIKYLPIQDII